jgi:hypothetical protein
MAGMDGTWSSRGGKAQAAWERRLSLPMKRAGGVLVSRPWHNNNDVPRMGHGGVRSS